MAVRFPLDDRHGGFGINQTGRLSRNRVTRDAAVLGLTLAGAVTAHEEITVLLKLGMAGQRISHVRKLKQHLDANLARLDNNSADDRFSKRLGLAGEQKIPRSRSVITKTGKFVPKSVRVRTAR